jgi:rubrerythrin
MLAGIKADALVEHDPSGAAILQLLHAIDRHVASEADTADQYERLATHSGDPAVTLVMRVIVDDEQRHHELLERIAATLRDALNWTHSTQSLPQSARTNSVTVDAELAAAARALIDEEKAGAAALRRLAQHEKSLDGDVEAILLEMMAIDSDKHARLLEFVRRRLAARSRAPAQTPAP